MRNGIKSDLNSKTISLVKEIFLWTALSTILKIRSSGKMRKIFLKGKKLDFLFIDDDHTYEGKKKDFESIVSS